LAPSVSTMSMAPIMASGPDGVRASAARGPPRGG